MPRLAPLDLVDLDQAVLTLPSPLRNIYNRPMSRISSLHRLQELDLDIDRSQARIAEIDAILANDSAVQAAQNAFDRAESTLSQARMVYSRAEHAVESQRAKIEDTEGKLYGGSITNPKELQDLQLESESLKRYLITLEEELLEAMVALDEAEKKFERARDEKDLTDTQASVENVDLNEEKGQLFGAIEGRAVERDAVLADISDDDLARYERLRARLGGMAVARLHDDSCGACGSDQPRSKLQEIRAGADMVYCAQCGRILYSG